jgi:tRNA threonylcarbamoyladenosine dehydratase
MMYSSEIPSDDVTLLPLANSELATSAVDELAPLRDIDVHIFNLPMLGSLPALLDLNIATYVSCQLTGRPIDRPTVARAPS